MSDLLLFISLFASIAAATLLYLKNRQLKRVITQLTRLDPVSKVPNRLAIMQDLELAFSLAKRYQLPFTLGMILIPRKSTQDSKEVLRPFAQAINLLLRETDLFGRLSDDTFIVALTHTNTHDARAVVERLLNHQPIEKHAPIYIGMSHLTQSTTTLSNLIKNCRNALNSAKESPTSTVQYHSDEPTQ
ncbi:MAG: GGDEF domain-containing protein [Gammaproteobacteria bacterium]|nr:GGDEF domain-containing protein [Gammaproteobacteria bacterium]NVK87607.1 GGDEF domain-containing protein [Gammaproteobacteria bacterium]